MTEINKQHNNVATRREYTIPGGHCVSYSPSSNGLQSIAIVNQNGRYPIKGFSLNMRCTETIVVLQGEFKLVYNKAIIQLVKGDVIYIEPWNKYSITGKGKNLVAVSPAWDPKQSRIVNK